MLYLCVCKSISQCLLLGEIKIFYFIILHKQWNIDIHKCYSHTRIGHCPRRPLASACPSGFGRRSGCSPHSTACSSSRLSLCCTRAVAPSSTSPASTVIPPRFRTGSILPPPSFSLPSSCTSSSPPPPAVTVLARNRLWEGCRPWSSRQSQRGLPWACIVVAAFYVGPQS